MCSLFDQSLSLDDLLALFEVQDITDGDVTLKPSNYPRQAIAVVRGGEVRTIEMMRWGLVPAWMKEEPKIQPFNARAETIPNNGLFRSAFKSRRCVLPVSRYAEYQGPKGARTPVWFEPVDGPCFGVAGLWEEWKTPNGQMLRTATMVTTEPNSVAADYHNRMPALLEGRDAIDIWMDNERFDKDELLSLLIPCSADAVRVGE